jgi:catechol 2,3-dioxygenase-like lactoylglutathione lyase family enzyme
MTSPTLTLLYVDSPAASAAFYEGVFGRAPVEASPTFAMFIFEGGFKLGLWARAGVEPAAQAAAGGGEIAFNLDSRAAVDDLHAAWKAAGVPIAQPPTAMDFGYTFVGLDPDGHRVRGIFPTD